jgi:hypothetical protein
MSLNNKELESGLRPELKVNSEVPEPKQDNHK